MKPMILSVVVLLIINTISSAPVQQPKVKPVEANSQDDVQDTGLEYDRYLREVVSVLEEDEDFKKKLESANVSEIKDGSIARHLEFVGHNVRTKLDEIKRREVERLQELARLKMKQMKGTEVLHNIAYHGGAVRDIKIPGHLDVMNPHSFEMKDLENLIKKTTNDLEELDKQRREEFKEYEMEKQYEEKEKLSHMTPEERKKEEERLAELKKKHGQHEKVNHPASKDQFEEVWENTDHLDKEDFNPKTFFALHDANSDGVWSIVEVEALLQHELDKVYDEKNVQEDDPMERIEEMNRMREHIFGEIDQNKDKFITREEFLAYTGPKGENKEFEQNEEWKTLDQDEVFNDQDYQDFLRENHREQQNEDYDETIEEEPDEMQQDPNVVNMNIGDPNQHYQQQLAQQQQMLHQQQQQAAQMAQQQHAALQEQAHLAQQQIQAAQQAQQAHVAAQQQGLHQGSQGIPQQQQQGVPVQQHQQGVPVQQQGLHGNQFGQPVVPQGQGQQQVVQPGQGQQQVVQPGQGQQQVVQPAQGQQQPVQQQQGQAQQQHQGQAQQQVVQPGQQGGQQPIQPNQVHVNQV